MQGLTFDLMYMCMSILLKFMPVVSQQNPQILDPVYFPSPLQQ